MVGPRPRMAGIVALICMFGFCSARAAESPRRGGILNFPVSSKLPSFDGHRETTFGVLHPLAPFYSTLIRVNPENPADPTDLVGDLAIKIPEPEDGGTTYTFALRPAARFWDGQPVTAHDVVATFNKIIFPPAGVISPRKAFYSMVEKVYATDAHTVVFALKHPSAAFIPALAIPFNWIYSARKLAQDVHWYEKNILGSGPFIFKHHEPGAFVEGRRNPDYYRQGKPYLDGFRAAYVRHQSRREKAIRAGEALIEFRGFPPRSRDKLVRLLGNQLTVQESDWNCIMLVAPNHRVKPFDDPRVRRALTLAIDRWEGSKTLSRIAILKTVGGLVFPGHPLAASSEELQAFAGYWTDLQASRAEARRLLREAGVPEGFQFTLHNRAIDQPYKIVGTWLATQWRHIGLDVEQQVEPTKAWYQTRRSGSFAVNMDPHCQSVVNPLLDVSKYLSNDRSGSNYAQYQDRVLDALYDRMNRTADFAAQRRLMRQFEKRVLDEQVHAITTLWWYRIVPHHAKLRGWKISPSHYLNQDLANVWLAR